MVLEEVLADVVAATWRCWPSLRPTCYLCGIRVKKNCGIDISFTHTQVGPTDMWAPHGHPHLSPSLSLLSFLSSHFPSLEAGWRRQWRRMGEELAGHPRTLQELVSCDCEQIKNNSYYLVHSPQLHILMQAAFWLHFHPRISPILHYMRYHHTIFFNYIRDALAACVN